jgi:antitoxin VapB
MFGALDIDSLQFETRVLLRRVRALTGESEDAAVHRALAERFQRLTGPASVRERRQLLFRSLESLWRSTADEQLGRGMSRAEEDEILGYGPEGV